MILKERTYRTCKACKARHLVKAEVYACDTCRKALDMSKPDADYLRANVHMRDGGASAGEIICCSWTCMVKALRKVKCDYFVSLPFLHFDKTPKGMRAEDFFALLRRSSTTHS